MGNLKLLGAFLAYFCSLGLFLGTLLGAAYGLVLLAIVVPILSETSEAIGPNFFALLSALYGGVFGAGSGLVLGLLNSLLLFTITRARYYPASTTDSTAYREMAQRTCAVASGAVFLVLGVPGVVILSAGFFESVALQIIFTVLLPLIAATLTAGLSGRLVAGWYTTV